VPIPFEQDRKKKAKKEKGKTGAINLPNTLKGKNERKKEVKFTNPSPIIIDSLLISTLHPFVTHLHP